jgi:hypothetical protein
MLRRASGAHSWLVAGGVAGGAALLLLVAWQRLFVRGLVPIDGWTITSAYPTWALLHAYLEAGVLPLWNPYRNLGEPLLADPQSMAVYPVFWALAPLSGYTSFVGAWVAVHTALASGFAAALAKRWYVEPAGALAAGIAMGLSGFFTARLTFLNHFAAAAWLPALIYLQSRQRPAALGLCLALQWLAGFPPFSILAGVALLAMAVAQGRPGWICLAKAGAWALGLAAVQWLPFLELLAHSTRTLILSAELAVQFSLSPLELAAQLFVPQWFSWRAILVGDPAIVSFYTGVSVLGLGLWGTHRGGRREVVLACAGLACALLALGAHLPGYERLPVLRVFRFPANWLLLASAALALLCAAGIRALPWQPLRWIACGVIALDLLLHAQSSSVSWAEAEFLSDPPPLAQQLMREPAPVRLYHTGAVMRAWEQRDLTSEADYLTLISTLAPSYGMAFGLQDAYSPQTLSLKHTRRFQERLRADPALLDMAGVSGTITRAADGELRLGRNPGARPRLFAHDPALAEVELLEYRPGAVIGRVHASASTQVVLSEVDLPGWTVRVDGVATEHERLEDVFIAVAIPPGEHELSFHYAPLSVRIGALVTAVSIIALIGALVRARIQH